MALIKCSECKKKISDKAECCINCGAPVVAATISEKKPSIWKQDVKFGKGAPKRQYILLIALVLIFAAMIYNGIDGNNVSSGAYGSASKDANYTIRHYAKEIVKEILTSPSTAKFLAVQIVERKSNYYMLEVTVDSQNSYSAMIRSYWTVILKMEGETAFYNPDSAVIGLFVTGEKLRVFKLLNDWPKSD